MPNVIESFQVERKKDFITTSFTLIKFSGVLAVLGLPEFLGFNVKPVSLNIHTNLRLQYGEGRYHDAQG